MRTPHIPLGGATYTLTEIRMFTLLGLIVELNDTKVSISHQTGEFIEVLMGLSTPNH